MKKQNVIQRSTLWCLLRLKKAGDVMWNEPTKEQLEEIPGLYETKNIPLMAKLIYQHFFIFECDWYIAEYDKNDDTFFGFAIINLDHINAEWGYISFQELRELQVNGIEVDCNINWKPVPAGEIDKIKRCINPGCFEN